MSSVVDIRVPDIGDFADVPVVEVYVAVGDTVEVDQTLIALESDKATLDVPTSVGGEIVELLLGEGDPASEGTLIARIRADAVAADATVFEPAPPAEAPSPAPEPKETPAPPPAPLPAPAAGNVHASPSIRKFARELGVDLSQVAGSGRKGRITRDDVTGFVKGVMRAPDGQSGVPIGGLALPPWPEVDFEAFGPTDRVPLSRIARISGPALARNAIVIPHVTSFETADTTDLEAFRKTINAENADGPKLTLLAFAVKAVVAALKAHPKFNASLAGEELVLKRYFHIGIAADTPEGLVVPVVRDADQKGVLEIAAEMADLAATARAGRLKPTDMQGGTFTISSLGGIGGTNFCPIINAPEVAILGMTRATIQPVWDGADFKPRLVQPLSLSWDHRVVDGVAAARFLKTVQSVLTDFRRYSL